MQMSFLLPFLLFIFVRVLSLYELISTRSTLSCKEFRRVFVGDPVYDSYVSGFVSVRAIGILYVICCFVSLGFVGPWRHSRLSCLASGSHA